MYCRYVIILDMKSTDKRYVLFISCAALLALAVWFALWCGSARYAVLPMLYASLTAALFGLGLLRLIPSALSFEEVPAPETSPRNSRRDRRHPWAAIACRVILLHMALYAIAYLFDLVKNGYSGGLLDTFRHLWLRTDSPSYLGIAENWYVTEGDARFHIVFFPLYPILIRIFSLFTGGSAFGGAMLVTTLCAIGSAIAAYELFALDTDRRTALFAATLLCLFPGSIFLLAPMTESLFLLTSLLCMYMCRKKKYLLSGLFGCLAALTRSVGILLILPVFMEAAYDYFKGTSIRKRDLVSRLAGCCMIALGTALYLIINKAVTGSFFTFMSYQHDHWSQSLGPFFGTAAYQLQYFLSSLHTGEAAMGLTLFLPNLICCLLGLIILALSAGKLRPSYAAYGLLYYAVTVGCTWLLSGPRYLAVCFPIAAGLCALVKGRLPRWILALLSLVMMLMYMWAYVLGYSVY